MSYFQVNQRCNGCLACVHNCPARALDFSDQGDSRKLLHNMARCARCLTCWRICPQEAIEFRHLLEGPWEQVVTLKLIRCEICGEPVFSDRLLGTLEEKLAELAEPRCDRHRARRRASAAAGRRAS